MDIELETLNSIAKNLPVEELDNLLEVFVDKYPDVFTNIIDNLEPIHLYTLCKTSKKGLNNICSKFKKQNNIIHNGIKYIDYDYGSSIIGIIIQGILYFIFSKDINYDGKKYDKYTPILIHLPITVFSVCFTYDSLCHVLDNNGNLYVFEVFVDEDDENLSITDINLPTYDNNILSINTNIDSYIINKTSGVDDNSKTLFDKPADLISCGHNFMIMLHNKQLIGYGNNDYGQLGYSNISDDNDENIHIIPIDNVISIHCGISHTLVLTSDNLYAFGKNDYGQLCLGDDIDRNEPTIVNSELFTVKDILKIACGYNHTMILTTKGLFGFGWDFFGKSLFGPSTPVAQKITLNYPISSIESIDCLRTYTIIKRKADQIYIDGYTGLIHRNHSYIENMFIVGKREFHIAYKI